MKRHLALLLPLLLFAAACSSNSAHLKAMHRTSMDDLEGRGLAGGLDPAYLSRQTARIQSVRQIVAEGGLESGEDYFYAGLILVSSTESDDLSIAQELGMLAGELGDARGLRVAAEAEDRRLLMQGDPQRWGTQITYQPILGKFRLEALDPRTTDEDRLAMGVPPLDELEARVQLLNALKDEDTQGR